MARNSTASRAAQEPLTWSERRQACAIADFLRRRRVTGRGESTIRAEAKRLWPNARGHIFDAAELLAEVRRDGWPAT
jgi:hypothetical protein